MEAVGGPQTWMLGGAFNCGKAPARPGRERQPRLPDVAVPRRQHPEHPRRGGRTGEPSNECGRPQLLVDQAAAASTADDASAIVRNTTSANLRWANNTLTTNGVMHAVTVTVVSSIRRADGISTGSVTASASTQAQVIDLVRAADAAARPAPPPRMPTT